MKITSPLKLIIALVIPLSVGGIAGAFTATAIGGWFETLHHPSFRPPNWLFGPVWTSLYILMGISLYIIWQQPANRARNNAIRIFAIQLLLNFLWSFLFFYFHKIGLALAEIITLWLSILAMLYSFYKVKPLTAYLNIPYLCWVTFATILNAGYFALN